MVTVEETGGGGGGAYGEAYVKGFSTPRIIFFSSFMSIMHA